MTVPGSTTAIPLDPLTTVLVLPDGSVHSRGTLLSGQDGEQELLSEAWLFPREQATNLQRPVRVSIGRPSGSVEKCLLSADGSTAAVAAHPPVAVLDPPDPRWDDGMPQHSAMLETARAAERASDWSAAQVAAERLAVHVHNDLGDQHPHTVLARELQGHFAVRARDWASAARLHTSAAAGRNRLLAPTEATARTLKNAVFAWMQAPVDKDLTETGYTLAHLLVRVAPGSPGPIAAVLSRLGSTGTP
ncbi:hypothetical protein [Streptomyces reticuliscabiei]|uniref:hypothetical protein n=1 Tax=Streptomyces reticuliscabiei TaxID=146821 RepID=UPI000A368127|nr:hypothetical protein [Streptomyces reticuliscabiei]